MSSRLAAHIPRILTRSNLQRLGLRVGSPQPPRVSTLQSKTRKLAASSQRPLSGHFADRLAAQPMLESFCDHLRVAVKAQSTSIRHIWHSVKSHSSMGMRHTTTHAQCRMPCPPENTRRPAASPFYAVTTIPPSFVRKVCWKAEESHKVEEGLENAVPPLEHVATCPA